ncbi:MAG TPA: SxtJ family membrane protein [Hyphomicrobiaceae bacterium]|nr:SxtJ family membrane protein [Hyphomicrobiaceae bacterium]
MTQKGSHHELGTGHHAVQTSSDRSFGLVFAAAFALLALYLAWHGNAWWPTASMPAPLLLVIALTRPVLLAPFNRIWTRIGLALGAIVAPVVMAFVYFALITPMAVLARLLGKDFLRLARDPAAPTYWIVRRGQDHFEPRRLRDQF